MAKIKRYQIGGYVVNQYGDTLRGKAATAERARQKQFEQSVIKENPASKIKPTAKPTAKPIPKKKAKAGGSFPDLNKDGKADILKGRGVIKKGGTIKRAKMGCASCGKTMKKKKVNN